MTIHSKMQFKIEELEDTIDRMVCYIDKMSCYIRDGRDIVKDYLDPMNTQGEDADLIEWAESGPGVSVARIKREALLQLVEYMQDHDKTHHTEIVRQWVMLQLEIQNV